MWPSVINFLKLFILYSLIRQCTSSIFLHFGEKPVRDEHNRLKTSNVHRGAVFALSEEEKNKMCDDYYSIQLYPESNSMAQANVAKDVHNPIHYTHRWLTQEEAKREPELDETSFKEAGLVVKCIGRGLTTRLPSKRMNPISPAFRTKWFYAAQTYTGAGNELAQYVSNFVVLSPEHVPLSQAELEKQYKNTREIITTLRNESPKYVDLIEKRDNLSTLSKKQKLNICACILSSPEYRQDRLEYSLDWIHEMNRSEEVLDYKEIKISFDGEAEGLKTDAILCKAFEDGIKMLKPTDMYLTRSYANGFSAIVVKDTKKGIFVDKYFKDIAELITAEEEMNSDQLFINIKGLIYI